MNKSGISFNKKGLKFARKKLYSPEDDQSLLIETSSCTPSSFSELITTQLRFHMVSPQLFLLKKTTLLPEREACSTSLFEGRVVGVKLTHDNGPRSVTLDLVFRLCHAGAPCLCPICSQNHTGHAICVYKMGYLRVSATDGTRLKFLSEQKLGVRVNFRFNQVSS